MSTQLARRVDAAAFALAMLAFCWWLHGATTVVAWLAHRQATASSPLLVVQVVAVLLVALAVPALGGRLVFRLIRGILRGCLVALVPLVLRLTRRRKAPSGVVSGGSR
jgi:hypothetical protein